VPAGPRIAIHNVWPAVTFAVGVTGTMLNCPATGEASVPVANLVPGWFVALFEYRPTTRLVAEEPASTKTRMFETVPVEAVDVLNASATPAAFESAFACTV